MEFGLDIGYLGSNGHHKLVEKSFTGYDLSDTSYSWLYLRGTGSIKLNDYFNLGLYTDVSTNYIWGDSEFFSTIVTPGISSRYSFNWDGTVPNNRATGFLELGIGYPIGFTGSPFYEFDFTNPSIRLELGHGLTEMLDISIGYNYTPMRIDYDLIDDETENLGGAFLKFGINF